MKHLLTFARSRLLRLLLTALCATMVVAAFAPVVLRSGSLANPDRLWVVADQITLGGASGSGSVAAQTQETPSSASAAAKPASAPTQTASGSLPAPASPPVVPSSPAPDPSPPTPLPPAPDPNPPAPPTPLPPAPVEPDPVAPPWTAPDPSPPAPDPQPPTPLPPAPVEPDPAYRADLEQAMVNLVNQERAVVGLPALSVDPELTRLARMKSADMVLLNYFSHTSPTYGSPFDMMREAGVPFTYAGENLASASSLALAHDGLMQSSGHRANILRLEFTHIGIGVVEGGQFGLVFTQMFVGR